MIIDSHFHSLSMQKRGCLELPEDLVGIDVGTVPGDYAERMKILPDSGKIFASVASGPWRLDDDDFISVDDEIEHVKADIEHYSPDAIGECGFDRYWKYGTPEMQRELFMNQVFWHQK